MSDIRVLFLYYIIDAAVVSYVGMALLGIRLNTKQVLTAGVFYGLVIWLVRGIYTIYGIPFGSHVLFNLTGVVAVLAYITRRGWRISAIAGLLGFTIIVLSESLILPGLYNSLQLTLDKVLTDVWLHIAMGHAGNWLLYSTAMFLAFSQKSLINVEDFEGQE